MTEMDTQAETRRRTATSGDRFYLRWNAEAKQRISRAAALSGVDASDFVRTAAEERAEEVLADHEVRTSVPESFFYELLAALDQPVERNEALDRDFTAARQLVKSDYLHRP